MFKKKIYTVEKNICDLHKLQHIAKVLLGTRAFFPYSLNSISLDGRKDTRSGRKFSTCES